MYESKDQSGLMRPEQLSLAGQRALVTGGATRIGREICLTLARAGAAVAVHYRSSAREAAEVVADIDRMGGQAVMLPADLNGESACRDLIRAAADHLDGLSILVNNASVFTRETLGELTEASMAREFWPNLFAPMLLSRYFADEKPESGVIVNLLDRRILANDARFFAYSLAKKGLADFTRLAAVALAPSIKVHGIAPGPILPPPGEDEAYLKVKGGKRLLEDRLDPAAIAGALMALLGLRGATGQILYIDAGQHLLGNDV
ncbi:MAG TPA: SDR family NAD(P)-dependent oxidoreductase [Kiritimatiellia bacterium]|nr:SDR family NAD(P)-dependent oxidoreductase [Kiritimatiellia bacterium]